MCVTSYQLAVQDASVFRRKKFYYLILDEAHNIKNFESRRWRTLLAFQAQRRLLLTGTPLQNSLMELWSLMHFLMPHLFRSRQEFSYWFSNPLSSAVEGRSRISDELVKRLHSIMRPFVLRRLKKDVAKQLPAKHEHEVLCKLSRRQQLLYEEFMSRSSTKRALAKDSSANFVSMMNVVMQLRKVCNHPDLFEPRPIVAPFVCSPGLCLEVPSQVVVDLTRAPRLLRVVDDSALRPPAAPLHLVLGPPLFVDDINSDHDRLRRRLDDQATASVERLHAFRSIVDELGVCSTLTLGAVRATLSLLVSEPLRLAALAVDAWGDDDDDAVPFWLTLTRNRARRRAPGLLVEMLEASSLPERTARMRDAFDRFVFAVPRAVAPQPVLAVRGRKRHDATLECASPRGAVEDLAVRVSRRLSAHMRRVELALAVDFPDRSLVQWDSGKFHKLAPLLRDLKRDHHRCLIFTQMSRMLDVLEAFLCYHGHSYSRLDGSTQPDERQRRVERFNTDESLFCMILSTRSGGLGINLTGADVVIFYDSDWNPAMDAQATDRAHRIGQTREVHIYRLVCEATVEENIIVKAKQKRKLEFVALTEGQFDAAGIVAQMVASQPNVADLAVQVEDAEDVESAKKAEQEAANEVAEFAETAGGPPDESVVDENAKLEAEFAAWQERVGPDPEKLADALKPVERKCLEGRLLSDLTNGVYVMSATERKLWEEMRVAREGDDVDVDAIEEEKMAEEHKACIEGDILVSDVYFEPARASTYERAFRLGRRRMHADAARRKCTGAAWERRHDAHTGEPFWYNVDTEEATWRTPAVIARRDAEIDARLGGYSKLAHDVIVRILSSLEHVHRAIAAAASRRWARAATDDCFVTTVLPVERLAASRKRRRRESMDDTALPLPEDLDLAPTHASLRAAIDAARPGETLSLAGGHYWEDVEDLVVDKGIRIIGDLQEPARVVVELGGAIKWMASTGAVVGLTLRRPRASRAATNALVIEASGRLCASRLYVDNDGAGGAAVLIQQNAFGCFSRCRVAGARTAGVVVRGSATFDKCALVANRRHGLCVQHGGAALVADSWLGPNQNAGVFAFAGAALALDHCDLSQGPLALEDPDDVYLATHANLGLVDSSNPTFADLVDAARASERAPSSGTARHDRKRALEDGDSPPCPTTIATNCTMISASHDIANGDITDHLRTLEDPDRSRPRQRRRHKKLSVTFAVPPPIVENGCSEDDL